MFQYDEEDNQARVVDSEPPQKALVPLKKAEEKQVGLTVPYKASAEKNMTRLLAIAPPTDRAFLKTWLHDKSACVKKDYSRQMINFYALTGGKSLRQVKLADIQKYQDQLADSPFKPLTQRNYLTGIKSAFSFGVKTGFLKFNVGAVVKGLKCEDTLAERILSEKDMARLLALEEHPRNHAILSTLYHAGLRVQELCDLQWRNVAEREGGAVLTIFGKGSRTRHIFIDNEMWEEIRSLKAADASWDDYVFQSRRVFWKGRPTQRRLNLRTIENIVSKAARRANIPGNVSPHWFRHCHATHSLENGAPLTLVRDTLGHSNISTTSRYSHARPNASSGQYLKV